MRDGTTLPRRTCLGRLSMAMDPSYLVGNGGTDETAFRNADSVVHSQAEGFTAIGKMDDQP